VVDEPALIFYFILCVFVFPGFEGGEVNKKGKSVTRVQKATRDQKVPRAAFSSSSSETRASEKTGRAGKGAPVEKRHKAPPA
jgi:hypothetical protein